VAWLNTKRIKRRAENRRRHHETLIQTASDPRQRMQAACGWLLSEAQHNDRLDDAAEWVLAKVHEIREEELHRDDHDYAK
jgi:hypothetical protein